MNYPFWVVNMFVPFGWAFLSLFWFWLYQSGGRICLLKLTSNFQIEPKAFDVQVEEDNMSLPLHKNVSISDKII